jgi:hypothetical protein
MVTGGTDVRLCSVQRSEVDAAGELVELRWSSARWARRPSSGGGGGPRDITMV